MPRNLSKRGWFWAAGIFLALLAFFFLPRVPELSRGDGGPGKRFAGAMPAAVAPRGALSSAAMTNAGDVGTDVASAAVAPVPAGQQISSDEFHVIRLATGLIDTSRSSDAGVLAERVGSLAFAAGEAMWIVQLNGPVHAEDEALLEKAGAKLFGYLPEFAFAARMDEAAVRRVAGLRIVQWIGPYKAGYKLQKALATQAAGAVLVDVWTFSPDDVPAVADAVVQAGGTQVAEVREAAYGRVRAELPAPALSGLVAMDGVQWIERYVRPKLLNNRAVQGGQLNVTNVWATHGLTGSNQIAAVADTGLDTGDTATIHPDFAGRIKAGIGLARTSWSDPDSHGTHVCGSVLGDGAASGGQYRGVAFSAQLVMQSIGDSSGALTGIPANLASLFTPAYTNGARVHSDSWGSSVYGQYTSDSVGVDTFIWSNPEMTICIAAGNDGTDANNNGVTDADSLGSPATAKNCITVGAAENFHNAGEGSGAVYGNFSGFAAAPLSGDSVSRPYDGVHQGMAAFSSRGPCDDGRIKPDLVAPGTDVISTRSRVSANTGWGVAPGNTNYLLDGGTSMATPLTAGCALLFRQFFIERTSTTNPSASLIKGAMINGARSLSPGQYGTGTTREIPAGSRPNNIEGWGHLDVENTLFPPAPVSMAFYDGVAIATGVTNHYLITLGGTNEARVTLCWSDYQGTAGTGKKLINDLDLSVIAPDGTTNFPNGRTSADRTNNVEGIDFAAPVVGTYDIRISGFNVPKNTQRYSLIVRGAIAPMIQHAPPGTTAETNLPYAIDATITSAVAVDTNQLSVLWNTDGSAAFSNAPMVLLSNNVYRGLIPAQPLSTIVYYYINALTNGLVCTAPDAAPANLYSFAVASNIAPAFASDSPTQFIAELSQAFITNSATDGNVPADVLTYTLVAAPSGMAINASSGVIAWTPAEAQGPSTNFVLTSVTDNGSPPQTTTNVLTVFVGEVNAAPVMPVITTKTNTEFALVTLTNRATDTDLPTNTLVYSLVNAPTGAAISSSGVFTWTPIETQGPSTNIITTVVTDDGVPPMSATNSFTLIIKETNAAPAFLVSGITQTVAELNLILFTNSATDSDIPTNTLTYAFVSGPTGVTVASGTGLISWTPSESQGPTNAVIKTKVTDNGSPARSVTNSITIIVTEVNTAPVPPAIADRTNAELPAIVITNRSTDADLPTNRLSYAMVSSPAGATINTNSGIITWTPGETLDGTTNLFVVITTDNGVPPLSATNSFNIIVTETNAAPVFPVVTTRTNTELTAFIFTNAATDSDIPSNTLTYSLLVAPSGMTIDVASGTISWTPGEAQGPSTNIIRTAVTDDGVPPKTATNTFTLIVTETNSAPLLAPTPDATIYPAQTFSITNLAADADIPTNSLTFSLVAAPTGTTIDSASGALSWTPSASDAGTTNLITVRVTDNGSPNLSADTSFNLSVVTPAIALSGILDGTILTWPLDASAFVLEVATNLDGVALWIAVTNPPGQADTMQILTNGPPRQQEFYRLRLP